LGRQLYPDLDLWATGKPFLKNWVLERRGPKALVQRFMDQAPLIIERLPEMPMLLHALVESQTMTAQDEMANSVRNGGQTRTPPLRVNPLNSRALALSQQSLLAVIIISSARHIATGGLEGTPWYLWLTGFAAMIAMLRGVSRTW